MTSVFKKDIVSTFISLFIYNIYRMLEVYIIQKTKRKILSFFFVLGVISVGLFSFLFLLPVHAETKITTLSLKNNINEARESAPFTWSVPLSKDQNITDATTLRLTKNGVNVPAQFISLARWGGTPTDSTKPIMWVLVDAQVNLGAGENASFDLNVSTPQTVQSPLRITQNTAEKIIVDTGAAQFEISKTNFRFFDTVTLPSGKEFLGNGGIFLNNVLLSGPATVVVEHEGNERISLRVHGTLASGLQFTARLHFYKNLSEVKVDFRVENLNKTQENSGQPNAAAYGTPGSVNFDDLSIRIPSLENKNYIVPTGELGAGVEKTGNFTSNISVIQESSGDANWNVMQSLSPRLQSGVTKKASTLVIDGVKSDGPNQIAGWLDANNVTIAVERAWTQT